MSKNLWGSHPVDGNIDFIPVVSVLRGISGNGFQHVLTRAEVVPENRTVV
jgi:hypothetical protein